MEIFTGRENNQCKMHQEKTGTIQELQEGPGGKVMRGEVAGES